MAVKYTPEQIQAIETLDKSVLVSAAAGSGKTAILVERILRIILEGKANVDELLVVTFTNAAAAEMKLRLASAIRKRMRENPEDTKRLKEQLSRLYRAYITTIDSFALRVIREFFYETDSDPDFKACDEVQGELMRREALAELFEEGFENDHILDITADEAASHPYSGEITDAVNSVGFREFMRLYSEERQEDSFKDRMLSAYAGLRSVPDYFDWAYGKAEQLNVTEETFEGSGLQAAMAADAEETFTAACNSADRIRGLFFDAGLEDMYEEKLAPEVQMLHEYRDAVSGGNLSMEMLERVTAASFIRLVAGKEQKEAYSTIKDEVSALRDAYKKEINGWNTKYMTPDLRTRLDEMNATYKYTVYYIRMLEEFERRYAAKKRERRVMDFADMEHIAVRILRNEEAAETLRRRFHYIFVDEYQDTNRIQEELISSIARPDNVFRVGDVKQSIYKFRQAEPEIFQEMYRKFSDGEEPDGTAIDLSMNFRSNEATINYINRVFEDVMEGYDDRARLNTGAKCDPEYDFIPEVHILTADEPEESEEDDETAELSKEEAEAEYIAGLAEELIGTEFHDTKTGEIRKAEARDIVILFRAVKTRGDVMAAALRRRGIEPHVEESDDYFDTVEIGVAMSLLSCIDNMKRDIPLIATLHSEVFGWTPSELAGVRIAHMEHLREKGRSGRPAFWEAMKWYREDGPDGELRDKAVYAADRLLGWRRLSHMMPLEDFIWYVLTDSGYYRMAGAMHGGARRQANLRTLADRAAKYSQETVASLSSYITFVDVMRQKKISTGQTPAAAGDDVIRISTIHKSKGLEYPFVIVGGLGHRFRKDNNEKGFSFDSSIGAGLPYIDPARKYWRSTLIQRAINAKSRRDGYSEELRVLYVAMTRARNRLIMVGTYDSAEKLEKYSARPDCYLKVMQDVIRTGFNRYYIKPLPVSAAEAAKRKLRIPDPDSIELTPEETEMLREIERRFSYRYPDSDLLTAKAKYSVSELRRAALDAEAKAAAAEADPEDARDAEKPAVRVRDRRRKHTAASAADIGTGYHRIMEFADFALACREDGSVDEEYIRECADRLHDNGAISDEVFTEIDTDRIAGFFRSDIGRRAAAAAGRGTLRKEKPFTLRTAAETGSEGSSGRHVLVQGVIDCCFEEDGSMVLIDYKSNFIKPGASYEAELERIRHEYRMQIDLYSEAVLKGTGLEVSEAYLYLFSSGEALRMDR